MKRNNIGWCDKTLNPVTGCPNGCEYCYARQMNKRFGFIPDFSKPQFFPERLRGFNTKQPQIIFIDSMSDIAYWKKEWRYETFTAMEQNQQNIYLALTKNYDAIKHIRGLKLDRIIETTSAPRFEYYYNLYFYIGATVTNNEQAQAVIDAGGADFISFEPLLERIKPELLEKLRCMWWIVGDLTKNGIPQGSTYIYGRLRPLVEMSIKTHMPLFMKDSVQNVMGHFVQEFPKEFIRKVGER